MMTWSSKDKTRSEIQLLYGKRKDALLAKNSVAEKHFESLLRNQPYYYIREKAFMGDGFLCYIDFFIPYFGLAIEIDGKEHNTSKSRYRDEKKSEYIYQMYGCKTYRIPNDVCLNMTDVDVLSIAKICFDRIDPKMWDSFIEHHEKTKPKWIDMMQHKTIIDLKVPIYAYSKKNDVIYAFKDGYDLKESVLMKNKDIFKNLNDEVDFMQANNFIFATDTAILNERIDKYKAAVQRKELFHNSKRKKPTATTMAMPLTIQTKTECYGNQS